MEDDKVLHIQSRQGDETATEKLCQRYRPLILKWANYYRQIRDDVEGECWLSFIEAISDYDSTSGVQFAAFVKSKVKWAAWSAVRGQRRWLNCRMLLSDNSEQTSNLADESAANELKDIDNGDIIEQWLAVLTKRQRQVLKMLIIDGWSNGEVAAALAISPAAVSQFYRQGLMRLRKVAKSGLPS